MAPLHGTNRAKARSTAILCSILALIVSCATAPKPLPRDKPGAWTGTLLVETALGRLRGKTDRFGTMAWLGVPYAEPPEGNFRWKPPRPAMAWESVRDATEFASPPIQLLPLIAQPLGSEDCLYLNVWRPATRETGLPVHVWIHGGDNLVGSADMNPDFHGQPLASAAKAVFVSINYRLGIFGWLAHPSLRSGDPETDSGNFGLLDIIESLRWIKKNIEAFGGDPERVTITGESSGALNVLCLLLAPSARGLFHAASAQSPFLPEPGREEAEAFADTLIVDYLVRSGRASRKLAPALLASMSGFEISAMLRSADPFDLMPRPPKDRVEMKAYPYPFFDGYVLPAEGFAALENPEKSMAVPLMIGTTKEEAKVFQWMKGMKPGDPLYQPLSESMSLRWRAENVDRVADALGSAATPVYSYRFDWGHEGPGGVLEERSARAIGASHGLDMSFFLNTETVYGNIFPFALFTKKNEAGRKALKSTMVVYMANFLASGDPNGPNGGSRDEGSGVPRWEPWDPSDPEPSFMVFDAGLTEAAVRIERGRADPYILAADPR